MKTAFTQKQLDNWKNYEDIRTSGIINMFDAAVGSQLTDMTEDDWIFCLRNYTQLKQAYEEGE